MAPTRDTCSHGSGDEECAEETLTFVKSGRLSLPGAILGRMRSVPRPILRRRRDARPESRRTAFYSGGGDHRCRRGSTEVDGKGAPARGRGGAAGGGDGDTSQW